MNSKKLADLKLGDKQNKLLTPLSKKLNEAIKKVALAKGYKIIVDITAVSYATEETNISKAVALELGIPIPTE
jgi:outer membrane protein